MAHPVSREHRLRVLANLTGTVAAERPSQPDARDATQMRMPLIVEVKRSDSGKTTARRARRKARPHQPDLGDF